MNNLDFVPGTEYTDYVLHRLDIEKQEDPLYRKNGKWYRPKPFQVDYEGDGEIGEIFVDYVLENFSDDARLVEARGFEAVGHVQVVEPTSEYEANLKEVGSLSELRELLISDSEEFPESDGVGYLNLDKTLENLSETLTEDATFGSVFLIQGVTEEDQKAVKKAYGGNFDEFEELPEFDLELQSRTFVNHNNQIYEVK